MNETRRIIALTLLSLAGLVSLALVGIGFYFTVTDRTGGDSLVLAGAVCVVITAAAGAIVAGSLPEDTDDDLVRSMMSVEKAIRTLSDQAALSDDARRVLNRTNERDLLCRAIEEDIRRHDWDAAQVLANELAVRFGYEQEADRFRMQIDMARSDGMDADVAERSRQLDRLLVEHRWDAAAEEARRMVEAYPAVSRVRGLPERVSSARQQYKLDLERRFLVAAQSERVDEAMELMRELDAYLTEQEAEPFQEVARGVIGKARDNLGAAFKLAYQDQQWGIATGLGEQIMEQFPNSRMAAEVQTLLPELRDRARAAT